MSQTAREQVISFLQNHALSALCTVSPEGQPRAACVYMVADENLDLYFMTKIETVKYIHIHHNPRVAVVTADENVYETVQIEGLAEEVHLEEKKHWLIQQLSRQAARHPHWQLPVNQLASEDYAFMKIKPTWLRWGRFQEEKGTHLFQQIIPAE